METIYLCIVIFLLCLAVFDLFVGVSNDAVNFLQSAVGARVATFRTVLIIASVAVVLGAVLSSGMMDIARHGIMMPARYSFHEVMTVFLAVMVTDVIILDVFNSLGMPTSTTVSLVFELLGGAFMISTLKIMGDPSLDYGMLLNSDKALSVIIAIFVSVAISFVVGMIVMWISRVVFTFNYKKHSRYAIAIFGGISFTVLAYFIFMKGVGNSPYVSESVRDYINSNINLLLIYTFIGSTIVMEVLHLCRVDIFKFVVLMGTFGLAMAFAGNDLVNFIGVPLAGLASYQDYAANAHGAGVDTFMMKSLMESAKTPPFYLMAAGIIMIVAMGTSKKAQNVIKTSVDLARQDEGDEMFGSSKAARAIVRFCQWGVESVAHIFPASLRNWINSRFNANEVELVDDKAAFDVVRAAVNLVIASMLITFGTNHKLPLSTTYVTFMVAMGSSLADRAWSRESAVFRVTGVLSVIGGWFITAGVAFITCSLVALTMWYGGIVLQVGFMVLVIYLLWHSNQQYKKKKEQEAKDEDSFRLMMRTRDPELVWDMLQKRVSSTQCNMNHYALDMFNKIMDGFTGQNARELGRCRKSLHKEQDNLKKYRRQEMLGLKKSPQDIAIERNTWFHLGANSDQQFIYCLRRMLEPVREHVYRDILSEADLCRDELSTLRKGLIDHIQQSTGTQMLQVSLVYLNILQETDEFLNIMRHQLRAAKKFIEN